MNENRNLFGLNGITGMLIATTLLLSILAFLTIHALSVQHENADNYYKVVNEKSIKMFSVDNAKQAFVDVK